MILKSIEIQGFKSFANRLVFEFHEGITGIVGPNGSGKSNIADAVRWVLGEQSAKQLRGQKMEDVIFAGTAARKPLGFAFVGITLDNSDHALPVSYDTVTVSRRVFRSGESEYKINGRSCRLKDIQEMFFDTGVGKEGYSIIGQGQIERILSGKPEERRELFDEAAGIVKFKKRKAAAMKDLELEAQNISRIEEELGRLQAQVGPLKNQSEKAKQYLALRDELKAMEANAYLISFRKLKEDAQTAQERLKIVHDQMAEVSAQLEEIKETYLQAEQQLEEYDNRIETLSGAASEQALQLQKLEGSLALALSRQEGIRETESLSLSREEETGERLQARDAEIREAEKELSSLEVEFESAQSSEQESTEKLAGIREQIETLQKEIQDNRDRSRQLMEQIAGIRSQVERHQAMQENAGLQKSQLSARLITLQSETDSEGSLIDAFSLEKKDIDREISENEDSLARLKKAEKVSADALTKAREEFSARQKMYHEESSRYRTLKNVRERYEGYGQTVRRVMQQKSSEAGLIGVVADIIRTKKKYEIAIETALGGSISHIVTEDEQTARHMIEYLKKNRYGRATFLPLTSIQGRQQEDKTDIRAQKGFIAMADELVDAEARFSNITSFLLGRIYVVDTIDHALEIARNNHYRLRIVTLDGESLNPGGSLSGGAYKNTGNLLARNREMDDAKKHVKELKSALEKQEEQIQSLVRQGEEISRQTAKLSRERQQLDIRRNTLQLRMNQVSESAAGHEKNIEELRRQLSDAGNESDRISQMIRELEEESGELETKEKAAQEAAVLADSKLDALSKEEARLSEEITQLLVKHSNIRQSLSFAREKLDRALREKQELLDSLQKIREKREEDSQDADRLSEEETRIREEIRSLQECMQQSADELQKTRSEREKYAAGHKNFFEQRESISDQLAALDREQVRLQAQKEKADEKRSELSSHMWEEYTLTYQQAGELYSEEYGSWPLTRLRKAVSDNRAEIRKLGDVNVNAIEQYKETSSKYEEMSRQHADLAAAREKLDRVIASLNTSMRRKFREEFARISAEFEKVFSQLFGGGKGTLALADPENLLETGILITAQPPGKKLQNIMQLSGGEKALTAIALLFAIQNLKPSPFCLLDEIEAALDDPNIERFAQYLRNLTKDTQFIVITHRRGTMRAADVLYGITMQEKGISTMVSVSLVEKELKN